MYKYNINDIFAIISIRILYFTAGHVATATREPTISILLAGPGGYIFHVLRRRNFTSA